MMLSTGNDPDVLAIEYGDMCRIRCVLFVAYAQLPMIIESPGIHLPLVINVEGVMVPAEDIPGFASMYLLNAESLLILVSCLQHSPYLTALGVTPAVDLTICGQGEGVMCTTANFLNVSLILLVEQFLAYPSWFLHWLICSTSHSIL